MSDYHLYLSVIPEALIASMLEPEAFGAYYAVGRNGRVFGEAIFFEIDPSFRSDDFAFSLADERCVTQPDGAPKSSVYLGIYNVLARIPVSAIGNLYLVTDDGRALELERGDYQPDTEHPLHLYQEFCPKSPMVASRLEPQAFCRSITDPSHPVHLPRIVFSDLNLGELADDPRNGKADDLPYRYISHLRDVLSDFSTNTKDSKLVLKHVRDGVLYRTVRNGFYLGDHEHFAYYPFPSREALQSTYYDWWRSAQIAHFD
ncbi:MAG: hypothetical protein VBE63_06895 [Lamprobacter sp.]|uniref:hypothetical protein n=1 Tax=Lamprobacter sp. TaxID=3100796 RepID=UPI002B258FE5|nr:hypothetical protein [Lamprobacter sp.]MEA3639655.1 hypothetical protein [Lamprobacter sp.]